MPLPGVHCHILNKSRQLVKLGEVGELYISGIGVSRGYIKKPELNTEKFVDLFLSKTNKVRAYATGDLCRLNLCNKLEYIDRIDNQLKVNGNRVELGEIEYHLANCKGVVQSVVVAVTIDKQVCLVGYYTICQNIEIDEENPKSYLENFLPEYSVPKYFIKLKELPLTSSGKVNKSKLPSPVREKKALAYDHMLSKNEQNFLSLFNHYTLQPLEWNDDFFVAGGDSISAIRLVSALYNEFSAIIPFDIIYKQRTPFAIWKTLQQENFTRVAIESRKKKYKLEAPLSSSQRSVWFLACLNPEDRAYHAKAQIKLYGEINRKAVSYSIQQVVNRHEIYRTAFIERDDENFQKIYPSYQVDLLDVDFSDLASDIAEAELAKLVMEDLNFSFKLDKLPLVRWALVKMSDQESVLIHIEHHLVHDGWSHNLFLTDFLNNYNQYCKGDLEQLEYPAQYADFCVMQSQWLDSTEAKNQTNFWVHQLKDSPILLNLPRKGEKNVQRATSGKTIRMKLQRESWQRIIEFTDRRGETPFSFVLSALNLVLGQYSGDKDVCIGSAFANRNWGRADEIIGMMINTVVLRNTWSLDISADEFLKKCFKTVEMAQNNQELPFENVVGAVNPKRMNGINPLFQVFLGFHDSPMPELDLYGISDVKVTEAIESNAAKFDLSIVLIPRKKQEGDNDPVHILWEYKQAVYSDWLIEKMMDSFLFFIDNLIKQSNENLSQLIPQEEPLKGIVHPVTSDLLIHRIFGQAERTPYNIAVQCQDNSFTYVELVDVIKKKAALLQDNGIGLGDVIGVCLERDAELVIWLLAIQAVGAAYIPLDPSYPDERLKYIVEHSQLCSVISSNHYDFPCVNIQSSLLSSTAYKDVDIGIDSIMYVLYTSGTTGRPKGVEISHYAFNNFIDSMGKTFPLKSNDAWLAVTSYSFDIAMLELFYPLLSGATVLLATKEQAHDPGELIRLISKYNVSYMQATPTTWRSIVECGFEIEHSLNSLCGGEALDSALASSLLKSGVRLFNLYGPTETTIWSCIHEITKENVDQISIGFPINNTQIYLLDDDNNTVPEGGVGHLWIAGEGLAKGYFHDDELTKNSFVTVSGETPVRRYKTGDLASINENGKLIFHGRSDYQIKLNGFRIELTEIEHVLRKNPEVNDVVVVRQQQGEIESLIAFVVSKTTNPDKFNQDCQNYLPYYMHPDKIVIIEHLPLTPNGKVDRNALPQHIEIAEICNDTLTDTEFELVNLYTEVLGITEINVQFSFFQLGGKSLSAIKLTSMIERCFSISLTVADFIDLSSIRSVAAYIDSLVENSNYEDIMEEISI
jgi:amino acid adenylation domain-containing protein